MPAPRLALIAVLLSFAVATAADPPGDPVRTFLNTHCVGCHGADKPKGKFRADTLTGEFTDKAERERWGAVLGRLKDGTMPPESKPRPTEMDAKAVTDWIAKEMVAGELKARATQGRTVLRRLNRIEYENTIRDLLGIDIDLQELLPADAQANGFDTSGEAHHTSSFLMEKYLEAADRALSRAIANDPQPPRVKQRYSLHDERAV
jgi:mono/diheme cytochrome c family protein